MSSNELEMFDVSGSGIRFGMDEDGTPYAVASDFAKAMGYAKASDATRLLDDDEKGKRISLTPGGRQSVTVIFEDGMWELIFRSNLPGAKVIKKRVKEILREIRETGGYQSKQMSPGEILVAQAQRFLEHEREIARIAGELEVVNAKIAGIEGEHDWFTCLAYAKLHNHRTDRAYLSRVGRYATALMRERGEEPHKRQDATFGLINTYPKGDLAQAFADVRP